MNTADVQIVITAGLVATACGLLGPFLVLRRVALLSDAVSHAVLPGIVATFLIFETRAPIPVILGAALFAVICVLGIEALQATGLVKSDAAIGLVFPALFSLGVLGVQRYAGNLHLDLDATIYGEIAFVPLQQWEVLGFTVARAIPIIAAVALANVILIAALWKELKATSFDPGFARTIGIPPRWLSRLLLIAVAVTAVTAFESVGAILVVTLLIVPAVTAYLLCERLWMMVAVTVAVGWVCATTGYAGALELDASIAGAMGLVAGVCFAVAFVVAPRHGLLARWRHARRARAHEMAVVELPRSA
jgi:manganese/zinc/iron transport system permease protein